MCPSCVAATGAEVPMVMNGELAYIRPASVRCLGTTTTATKTTVTPSAHAAALLIRMLRALLNVCHCRTLSLVMTPDDVAARLLLLLDALDGLCGAA